MQPFRNRLAPALVMALACACNPPQQNDSQNNTADIAAIRKTIEDEDIDFYQNQDRMAWLGYWHVVPESRWWFTGLEYTEYWKEQDFKNAIAANNMPPADNAKCTFTDFVVKADGNIGWATYDKKTVTPAGKTELTHEFRGMQKVEGNWKIVSASVHQIKIP